MNLLNFLFFAFFTHLPSTEGKNFLKKIVGKAGDVLRIPEKVIRETERVVNQAFHLPENVIRETERVVHQAENLFQKKKITSLDGTTRDLELGKPQVVIEHQQFKANTYEELVKKLREIGIEEPEEFSRRAMEASEKLKIEWRFVLPAMDAPDNRAKMSVIGIIATKEDSKDISVVSSRMSSEFEVKATETFHWRTQVKHLGNNHERKNDVTQRRGLIQEEINVIYNELVSSIRSHPDYASLPGAPASSFGEEL
jgi:hypothetical protein